MFRKLLYLATAIFATHTLPAQNVEIPDARFKDALLSVSAINTNGDGEIQLSEAKAFKGEMNLSRKKISDLTGIEAFENLTALNCSNNDLSKLSVSNNRKLRLLNCSNNSLSELGVSFNNVLEKLYCSANLLTELNVSGNPALNTLLCYNNKITALDLSHNPLLEELSCWANQIVELDFATNPRLERLTCHSNRLEYLNLQNLNPSKLALDAKNNLNLACVQVDNIAAAKVNWPKIDSIANFRTDCTATLFPNTPYNLGVSMPAKILGEGLDAIYIEAEQLPRFAGCADEACTNGKILDFVKANLKYPEQAIANSKEGLVSVSFIVEKDGSFSDVKVLRGIGDGCDEEVLRLVGAMVPWVPAQDKGETVRAKQHLIIAFKPHKSEPQLHQQPKKDASVVPAEDEPPTKGKKKKKCKNKKKS
jgi:TonB family protein